MTLALQRLTLRSSRAVTNSRASRCSRESTSNVCHKSNSWFHLAGSSMRLRLASSRSLLRLLYLARTPEILCWRCSKNFSFALKHVGPCSFLHPLHIVDLIHLDLVGLWDSLIHAARPQSAGRAPQGQGGIMGNTALLSTCATSSPR